MTLGTLIEWKKLKITFLNSIKHEVHTPSHLKTYIAETLVYYKLKG